MLELDTALNQNNVFRPYLKALCNLFIFIVRRLSSKKIPFLLSTVFDKLNDWLKCILQRKSCNKKKLLFAHVSNAKVCASAPWSSK